MNSLIPKDTKLLSIILYSDSTNCDHLGKSQQHPVFISLGNIKARCRNKPDAKHILGYFPIIKATSERERKSLEFKNIVKTAFSESLKIMLGPLFNNNNQNFINLKIDGRIISFVLKISAIIADLLEASTYCLTYKSSQSNFPCHCCLVHRNDLNNMELDNRLEYRTHESMRRHFNNNLTKSYSIENFENIFWKIE